MRMRQLFLACYYFRSNMAAKHVVVIFELKVEDAFDSFEEVETEDRTVCSFTNNQGSQVF